MRIVPPHAPAGRTARRPQPEHQRGSAEPGPGQGPRGSARRRSRPRPRGVVAESRPHPVLRRPGGPRADVPAPGDSHDRVRGFRLERGKPRATVRSHVARAPPGAAVSVDRPSAIVHRPSSIVPRVAFLFLLATAAPAFAQSPVLYHLSFPAPEHHWMQVEVRFDEVPAGPLRVMMSRTSPGRY